MDHKIAKLKELLRQAEKEGGQNIKEKAKEFLSQIDANELVMAEQEMLKEGVKPEDLRHLCPAHMELLSESGENIMEKLDGKHLIKTLMLEHQEILSFLDKLDIVSSQVAAMDESKKFSKSTLEELKGIAHHLVAAEKHHLREEDVLFPELEKNGVYGPPTVMRGEHVDLRAAKKSLSELIEHYQGSDFEKFKEKLKELAEYIVFNLRDHIFKEDNILYPTALKVIKGPKRWEQLRKECDKIGYCCFTPLYLK